MSGGAVEKVYTIEDFITAVRSGNLALVKDIWEGPKEKRSFSDIDQQFSYTLSSGYRITSTALLEATTNDDGSYPDAPIKHEHEIKADGFTPCAPNEMIDYLIEQGANIEKTTRELGHSVLHGAMFFGNWNTALHLMTKYNVDPLICGEKIGQLVLENALFEDKDRVDNARKHAAIAKYFEYIITHPEVLEDKNKFKNLIGEITRQPKLRELLLTHWSKEGIVNFSYLKDCSEQSLLRLGLLCQDIFPEASSQQLPWMQELTAEIKKSQMGKLFTEKQLTRFARYEALMNKFKELRESRLGYPTTFAHSLKGKFIEESGEIKFKLERDYGADTGHLVPDGPLNTHISILDIFLNNVGAPESDTETWQMHTKEFEKEIIEWLGRYFGSEASMSGYVTNGGTEGNDAALLWHKKHMAQKTAIKPTVIMTTETHYSGAKGAGDKLGLECKELPITTTGEMDIEALRTWLSENPGKPVIVMATAGTTRQTAFDNIIEIKKVLEEAKVEYSIHLDAAYAAMTMPITKPYGEEFDDYFKYVDTLSFSGHKFLGLPFPCGVILTPSAWLAETYAGDDRELSVVGTADTTYSGSRNGHSVIMMHNLLATLDVDEPGFTKRYGKIKALVISGQERAKKFHEKILAVLPEALRPLVEFNPKGGQIVFPMPEDCTLMRDYQLMPIVREGKPYCAGALIAFNISDALIDEFAGKYAQLWKATSEPVLKDEGSGGEIVATVTAGAAAMVSGSKRRAHGVERESDGAMPGAKRVSVNLAAWSRSADSDHSLTASPAE